MSAPGSKLPATLATVAVVVCLAFALFTRHAWEDYLITFRASNNLAMGNGLVFQPGERVHSYTSPLGTLVPALFALGGGDNVEHRALWGLRLVSAGLLAAALFLALRRIHRDGTPATFAGLAGLIWVLDPKIVDFSMNGMEPAFLVFFLTWSWVSFAAGARPLALGVGLAGLQWSRPDGFIFFGALSLAWLLLSEAGTLRQRFGLLLRVGAIGFALYLPWLVFTTVYYGTPIPHTITAKQSQASAAQVAGNLALYPVRLLAGKAALNDLFLPAYAFFGGWPTALAWFSRLVVWGAALACLWPRVGRNGRIASAAFLLGGFYVEYIPRSPWYYPVWQTLACISWAYLLSAIAAPRADGVGGRFAPAARILGLGVVTVQAGLLLAVAWQMKTQQSLIETNHRREIGYWLRNHAKAGDRVYLEPLGYIGYYSGLKMLDFPGLSSPEVVASRRAGHHDHAAIISDLQPEWLVLRPHERSAIDAAAPELLQSHYRPAQTFDAREKVRSIEILPGRGYLFFDAVFTVYARANSPGDAPR